MTDNDLRMLLRDAADEVSVPRLPTDQLHLRTRSIRRRRRTGLVAAAAALVLACGIGTYAVSGTVGDDSSNIAKTEAGPRGWAVAEGGTVHFGDGTVVTYGGTVNDLRYTSVGLLARSTQANARLSLITTAGVEPLDLGDVSDRLIGTDPDSPYVAWTVKDGDGWLVRVMDLGKGEKVTDVPVSGKYTWAAWKTPPVAIDGDHVYVGLDDRTLDVEWPTGEVSRSKGLPGGLTTDVVNGRGVTATDRGTTQQVVDVATGKVLVSVRSADFPQALASLRLAPDGVHALASPYRMCDEHDVCRYETESTTMFDLDRGTTTTVALGDELGWTPEGQVIRVNGTKVEICDELGRGCTPAPFKLKEGASALSGSMRQS